MGVKEKRQTMSRVDIEGNWKSEDEGWCLNYMEKRSI